LLDVLLAGLLERKKRIIHSIVKGLTLKKTNIGLF